MTDNLDATVEYAIATRTIANGEFDRIDTGRERSGRDRKGYSYHEAVMLIAQENVNEQRRTGNPNAIGAILMTREVTAWAPIREEG